MQELVVISSLLLFASQVFSQNATDDDSEIRLFYYPNTQNVSERIEIDLSNSSSFNAITDKGKRAKIMVHGANGNCRSENFPLPSIQAYLYMKASKKEDYNVFCLDYQLVARVPYSGIPGNSRPTLTQRFEYVIDLVGNKTTRYIMALQENKIILGVNQVHLVGHSLGGQVVGVTGRKVKELLNFQQQLGRITGLDVMNLFMVYQNEVKLSNQIDLSDAAFVDIVHTVGASNDPILCHSASKTTFRRFLNVRDHRIHLND